MKFKTIREALEFAIQKEDASCRLYRDLAGIMEDQATKMLFEGLLANEIEHVRNLEFEMIKQGYTTLETAFEISDSDFVQIERDDALRRINSAEALQMAIRKEKAAFQLYSAFMIQSRKTELRELFFELAMQEMRHLIKFEDEYQRVIAH